MGEVTVGDIRAELEQRVAAGEFIGVTQKPGERPIASVVQTLRSQRVLLILDNCEHVIDAAAAVADALIRSCRDVSLLTTSREPLGISGERIFWLEPLSTPADGGAEAAARHDAVKLFLERVRMHESSSELTGSAAAAVARICRRLDGMPLALELAAARTRAVSVEELDRRLDDRFRILNRGSRVGSARQRTLHATVDWSYHLLDMRERALFRRLSVFGAEWDAEAADAV